MEYTDYHDDGRTVRVATCFFDIELSNGWTVFGDGKIHCVLDDIEGTAQFECRITGISDRDDNNIPEEMLDGEIGDEFDRKFEDDMVDLVENPRRWWG